MGYINKKWKVVELEAYFKDKEKLMQKIDKAIEYLKAAKVELEHDYIDWVSKFLDDAEEAIKEAKNLIVLKTRVR